MSSCTRDALTINLKHFITNGTVCNFMVAQCITNPDEKKHNSFSLIIVPADTPGIRRGGPIDKMGQRASNTLVS